MERIIIQGDTVSLLNVQEEKTVSLTDFKEEFSKMVGVRTPILPSGCVFYAVRDKTQVLVIEKKPGNFRVKYKDSEFEICFPWHYFLLEFSGYAFEELYFFFRNRPLSDVLDDLLIPPVKNLSENGHVCLGHELRFSINGSLHNKVAKVVSYFYESRYNDDIDGNYMKFMPEEIVRELTGGEERFCAWERLAQEEIDPCTLSWHKYKSLNKVLEEIL